MLSFIALSIAVSNVKVREQLIVPKTQVGKAVCIEALVVESPKETSFKRSQFLVKSGLGKIKVQTKSSSLIPAVGDLVYIQGKFENPQVSERFNEKIYLKAKGVSQKLVSAEILYSSDHNSYEARFLNLVSRIQSNFLLIHKSLLSPDESAVIQKILIGRASKEKLNKNTYYAIQNLGVSHIFAASGFHLTTLCLFLFYIFKLLKIRKAQKILFTLFGITLYALMASWSPSIFRAWFIATIALSGQLIQRKINLLNTLIFGLIISLLIDPNGVGDIGLQFSYLAVLGIVLWAEKLIRKMTFVPRSWAEPIAVALSAQAFLIPLQIYYFHNIPIYFLIANLFAVPLAGLILILGLSASFVSMLGSLGWFIASGIEIFTSISVKVLLLWLNFLNSLPAADLRISNISFPWVIWLYFLIIYFAFFKKYRLARHSIIASFVCLLVISFFTKPSTVQAISLSKRWYEAVYIKITDKIVFVCNPSTVYLDQEKFLRDLRKLSIKKVDWWIGFCKKPKEIEAKKILIPKKKTQYELSKDLKIISSEGAVLINQADFSGLILFKPLLSEDSKHFYSLIKFAFPPSLRKEALWSKMPKSQYCMLPNLAKKKKLEVHNLMNSNLMNKRCEEFIQKLEIEL
ncbi:MAG: ComEC/Rec2 family competence protein [Candidatus Caenarcaniphilales bacterium]|nr:ComEC/Rec2 family competence protein [Candidatus Caenarcaniphilales bacterium]